MNVERLTLRGERRCEQRTCFYFPWNTNHSNRTNVLLANAIREIWEIRVQKNIQRVLAFLFLGTRIIRIARMLIRVQSTTGN